MQSPNNVFAGVVTPITTIKRQLTRYHPFGCPSYILEATLQDGKKTNKWAPKSHQGVYLGKSRLHSPSVTLILNNKTDHISPQYHVVMDTKFDTVQTNKPNNLSLINNLPVEFTSETLGTTFQTNFDMDEPDTIEDVRDTFQCSITHNNTPSIVPISLLPPTHPLNSIEFTSQQEASQTSEGDYAKTLSSESLLLSEGDNQRKRKRECVNNLILSNLQKQNIRNARKHVQTTSFDIKQMPEHNNNIKLN